MILTLPGTSLRALHLALLRSLLSIVLLVALKAHLIEVISLKGVYLVSETPHNALLIEIPVGFPITLLLSESIPRALLSKIHTLKSVLFTSSGLRWFVLLPRAR